MKSIFVICDKDGNPFTDSKGKDYYKMTWAYANKAEAEECVKTAKAAIAKVFEYTPKKG